MKKWIRIDVAGLCSFTHACNGCAGKSRHCCSSYDVTLDRRELPDIVGCIPMAARLCPQLGNAGEYRNIFDQEERDLFSIDTDENNLCSFAYRSCSRILCSLHTIAFDNNLALNRVKPLVCLLWPLSITDGDTPILTVQDDIFEFDCNKRRRQRKTSLSPSVAATIDLLLGEKTRKKIDHAAAKGIPWVKASIDEAPHKALHRGRG
jgi:hypothetical protein